MGSRREERENQSFEAPLSPTAADWLRVRFLIQRGAVLRFTAQDEAISDDITYPVIRWDTAHGVVDWDTLDREGRVVDKLPLSGKSYTESLTEAIADIRNDWSVYRDPFVARNPR